MFHQVQTSCAIRAMCTDSSLKDGHVQSREQLPCRRLSADSLRVI